MESDGLEFRKSTEVWQFDAFEEALNSSWSYTSILVTITETDFYVLDFYWWSDTSAMALAALVGR